MTSGTLTTREAADILGVHPTTIRRLHGLGILPAARATPLPPLPRSPRRFRIEDVEAVRERTLAAAVLERELEEAAA